MSFRKISLVGLGMLLSWSALAEDKGVIVAPPRLRVYLGSRLNPQPLYLNEADTPAISLVRARELAKRPEFVRLKQFFEKVDQLSYVVQKNSKKVEASFKEKTLKWKLSELTRLMHRFPIAIRL